MQTYRVYWLGQDGRIKRGDWMEAESDADAHRRALELCDHHTETIQVWQATRPVDEIHCHDRG